MHTIPGAFKPPAKKSLQRIDDLMRRDGKKMPKYLLSYDEADVFSGKLHVDADGIFRGVPQPEDPKVKTVTLDEFSITMGETTASRALVLCSEKNPDKVVRIDIPNKNSLASTSVELRGADEEDWTVIRADGAIYRRYRGTDGKIHYGIRVSQLTGKYGTISEVADPQLDNDAANKKYVDQAAANAMVVASSTPGSTKKFRLSVDDSGTVTAVEVTGGA